MVELNIVKSKKKEPITKKAKKKSEVETSIPDEVEIEDSKPNEGGEVNERDTS